MKGLKRNSRKTELILKKKKYQKTNDVITMKPNGNTDYQYHSNIWLTLTTLADIEVLTEVISRNLQAT